MLIDNTGYKTVY